MKKTAGKKTPAKAATRTSASKAKVRPPAKPPAKVSAKAPAKRVAAVSRPAAAKRKAPMKLPVERPRADARAVTKLPPPARATKPGRAPRDAATRKRMARFRDVLRERHRSMLDAYSSGKGNTREVTSDGTEDYIDYAVSSYDRDFSLSLTEMERRHMLMIEDALRRIDRGEYGHCLQCGQEIPEKRLEVEPWARHCVRCQELEEQGLLQQQSQYGFDTDYDEDEAAEEAGEEELGPEVEPEEDSEELGGGDESGDDDDEMSL